MDKYCFCNVKKNKYLFSSRETIDHMSILALEKVGLNGEVMPSEVGDDGV